MTRTKLDIKILDDYKRFIMNRCSSLYGKKYLNDIEEHLNELNGIYITDELPNYINMQYLIKKHFIEVNKSYLDYDSNGDLISFYKNTRIGIKHTLIHELLHAASNKENYNGVYVYNAKNKGLNEGITQMIADDITGYVKTKYTDGYNHLKTAVKILRCTIGNEVICDDYFGNSKNLKNVINTLSGDGDYFDVLLGRLNALNETYTNTILKENKQINRLLFEKKCELFFREMIINIVIPHLLKLKKDKKLEYLTRLMLDIGEDDSLKRTIKSIISEYGNKSDIELLDEKEKLINENKSLENEFYYLSLLRKDDKYTVKYYIKNDGTILLLGNPPKKITNSLECRLIYSKVFKQEYNFDPSLYDKIIDNIKKGNPLNIKYKDVKSRRIVYSGIVRELEDRGYYLLNDYRELDNHYQITRPLMIKEKLEISDFKELTKFSNKYYVKIDNYKMVVKDRNHDFVIDNLIICRVAKFVDLWKKCFKIKMGDSQNVVFTSGYEPYYIEIMNALSDCYNNRIDFNINYIITKCNSELSKNIVKNMLSTPTRVEVVFEFVRLINGSSQQRQERVGRSYSEAEDSTFRNRLAQNDADNILSSISR